MKFGLDDTTIGRMLKVFETHAKVDEVILFGSRAKGNYKEGSDIDLAVKGRNITFDDILKLHGQLDELNLPYKIDLLDYATIKEKALVEHIDRVGIVFYERWKKAKLGNIISIKGGFSYKGEFIGTGSSILLGMGCVSFNDKFLHSGARLYSGDCPNSHIVKPNDIVLATRQCRLPIFSTV